MSEMSSMGGGDRPTRADVGAMKAWTGLGASDSVGGVGDGRAYGDGRIFLPGPVEEAAREAEESARAREERHAEGRARIMRAVGGALGLSHAAGLELWASPSVRGRMDRGAEDHGGDSGEVGSG